MAQGDSDPGVIVRTSPPGCQVTLLGEAKVCGVAPAHFRQPLIGDYILKIERPGWETYTRRLVLDPTKQISVDVDLSQKTRFKAAARSFFIPGWGQWYADEPAKAGLFAGLMAASGIAYLVADNRFDDRNEEFRDLQRRYDALPEGAPEAERDQLWNRLVEAQAEASDAEDVRRVTIGSAVAVWALNMVDVLFFFPEREGTFSIKGVAVTPGPVEDGFGVTLSSNF